MPSGRDAYDLTTGSLRLINAISVGETPTADEANDAFDALSDLLETWSTEVLTVPSTNDISFNLVQGQSSYNIGPALTNDWVTPRPLSISSAFVTNQGVDFPMVAIGLDQFNSIALKTSMSDMPNLFTYINSAPTGIVRMWPVPSSSLLITFNADSPIVPITSLSSTLNLPPGMWVTLQYELAIMLWPRYNGAEPVPDILLKTATRFKANFKRANRKQYVQQFDPALSGICYTDWRTG